MLDLAAGIEHLGNLQVLIVGVFVEGCHRYGQHFAGTTGNKKYLGGHFRHQCVVGVLDIQQHGVKHHFTAGATAAGAGRAAAALIGLVQGFGRHG
ncbi:hypothetical protein D3C77_673380 [compost metagenome]